MQIPLLTEITIIFGLSIFVLFICYRLGIPTIVGFLLTGVIVGPHGLGFIKAIHEVEILAEIGVVLLLFTIGIEFSLKKLLQIKRSVLLGGSVQVLLSILLVSLITWWLGWSLEKSIFIGFLVSLSSTAIVLRILQERAEIDSPHGRIALAVLIFQDIVVVPMMLLIPLLAGERGTLGSSLFFLIAKGVGVIIVVILSAQWIVPKLLFQVARTRSRELFLLSIIVICLSVTWLTSSIGLSLALGAFLAGLIISESEYSHQALSNLLPFRDVFTSFFFISIGMLLDIGFLIKQPLFIVTVALIVLLVKTITAGLGSILLGFPLRTAVLVGFSLCQVGEFSFILSRGGLEYNLLSDTDYQAFLSVSILTMASTPFIISLAPRISDLIMGLPLPKELKRESYPLSEIDEMRKRHLRDHLIIVGFGVNGRNVARAAKVAGIPYVIIEMNPETVRAERERGEPIYYGDAVQQAVLEHAGIRDARVMVIAISDPAATRRITAIARDLNPKLYIIARTRFVEEMKPLYELGANEVIPEEFETSIEIFTRVLTKYLVPRDEIEKFISEIRSDGYEMFRSPSPYSASLSDLTSFIPNVEISTLRVSEGSPIVGKSLSQIELRNRYGINVLAISRDSNILPNPAGDTVISANDVLIVLGEPNRIAEVADLFRKPENSSNTS